MAGSARKSGPGSILVFLILVLAILYVAVGPGHAPMITYCKKHSLTFCDGHFPEKLKPSTRKGTKEY
jgi:hypothetical protein